MDETQQIRINKYLSQAKYCSRRQADKFIEDSRVRVDGEIATKGMKINPKSDVTVDGEPVVKTGKFVYIAYNKPVGVECTTDLSVKGNIIDSIGYPERIFPVGRLDKDSRGLILLTNDGEFANRVLMARHYKEKEYRVVTDKPFDDDFLENMRSGVPILDMVTRKCKVERISSDTFDIVLTQGLNRQIRRMCGYLGYGVKDLVRTRIMNIELGGLKQGNHRKLSESEIKAVNGNDGQGI